jgi:hypothetical protein
MTFWMLGPREPERQAKMKTGNLKNRPPTMARSAAPDSAAAREIGITPRAAPEGRRRHQGDGQVDPGASPHHVHARDVGAHPVLGARRQVATPARPPPVRRGWGPTQPGKSSASRPRGRRGTRGGSCRTGRGRAPAAAQNSGRHVSEAGANARLAELIEGSSLLKFPHLLGPIRGSAGSTGQR